MFPAKGSAVGGRNASPFSNTQDNEIAAAPTRTTRLLMLHRGAQKCDLRSLKRLTMPSPSYRYTVCHRVGRYRLTKVFGKRKRRRTKSGWCFATMHT
mmetsp:Transcript_30272/g.59466  ORF Transcript_30272/g.59466 Transcript_30272/m.59466 type:complete len:97 (+) Transcript_30272:1866-2156(+)